MYKVMIVDDEDYVRSGIIRHFPWAEYDAEIVGEARDGEEALKTLLTSPVDILITDVKMPRINGIELANTLAEQNKETKIIFISGYDDFDFLRSALKMGAMDYILKPIMLDSLEQTIRQVIGRLECERQEKVKSEKNRFKLDWGIPYLRRQVLKSLALEKMTEDIAFNLQDLDIEPYGRHGIGLLTYPLIEREKNRTALSSIYALADALLRERFRGCVFEADPGVLVALILLEEDDQQKQLTTIEQYLFNAAKTMTDYLGIQFLAGPTGVIGTFDDLAETYDRLRTKALIKEIQKTENNIEVGNDEGKKMLEAILQGKSQKAYALLHDAIEAANAQKDERAERVMLFSLLLLPADIMQELSAIQVLRMGSVLAVCQRFMACTSTADCRKCIEAYYTELIEKITGMRTIQSSAIAQRIKEIISRRYQENIQISDIAKDVYLTPTYISRLFKQKTGKTIGEYLTAVRIKRAKELLENSTMKLYEISYAVGYTSSSYFARIFKQSTGFSPMEYRDQVCGGYNGKE